MKIDFTAFNYRRILAIISGLVGCKPYGPSFPADGFQTPRIPEGFRLIAQWLRRGAPIKAAFAPTPLEGRSSRTGAFKGGPLRPRRAEGRHARKLSLPQVSPTKAGPSKRQGPSFPADGFQTPRIPEGFRLIAQWLRRRATLDCKPNSPKSESPADRGSRQSREGPGHTAPAGPKGCGAPTWRLARQPWSSPAFGTLGLTLIGLAGSHGVAFKQSWADCYQAGLKACRTNHWSEARNDFKQAELSRRSDSDRPTITPGSPEEPNRWRNGAPYSPNFLAAYCEYRLALDSRDPAEQIAEFQLAGAEFERLIHSGQASRDACFYLDLTYTRLNEEDKRGKLKSASQAKKRGWKVDEDPLAPEEVAAIQQVDMSSNRTPRSANTLPGISTQTVIAGSEPYIPSGVASVPRMQDKFSIVIGEDGAQLGPNAMPFASYDASVIRDGLVNFAGYDATNVTLIQNGSAPQILDEAKALAAKVPQDAVVLVFYAGPGVCVQGKDYLAASDSSSRFDTETMVAKSTLYGLFLQRGARIFSFYEVNRPIENGLFFGSEVPQVGAVSQMEATIPDSGVTSTVANGHTVGLYAQSFIEVLAELRSNRVPIYEFGWQLYNKMRRGNSGQAGGGGHQTPTLPVLNNLASDARF